MSRIIFDSMPQHRWSTLMMVERNTTCALSPHTDLFDLSEGRSCHRTARMIGTSKISVKTPAKSHKPRSQQVVASTGFKTIPVAVL